jgi:uncharacterized protein
LKRIFVILLLVSFLALLAGPRVAATPPKPTSLTYVYDYADMLSEAQENSLRSYLAEIEQATTAQVVIVTDESLEGKDVMWAAQDVFQLWGIGQKDKNNGLLSTWPNRTTHGGSTPGMGWRGRCRTPISITRRSP